jgi:ParB/RepB/Spo0J family partition protein
MGPGMLPASPVPIRTSPYSKQKANLAMSNIISVPLNKLTRSARNVRKSGSESIDDLASSILVHGLIHNLTVVEQFADNGENSGKYEVVAGGRRFAALQRLAKQKKVPKTFAVPCLVVDPAAATETSLAENTIRVAMHPADQFIAFHDLVVQTGLGVYDVAARFGVSSLFVRQRLKLANVAPRFIKAYRAEEIRVDQLVTDRFAHVVADLQAQGWAWAEVHLENDYWEALQKYNALRPAPVELDPALLAEADKLRAELDAIDQASDEEEPSDEAERRRDEIEIRLDEIEAGQTEFTGEQKSQAGVIVTIGHNGKPVYHCGLVERRGKGVSTNDTDSDSPKEEKDGVSAALLQDLTIQRTAALRAALSVRPDIALIAITHTWPRRSFMIELTCCPAH